MLRKISLYLCLLSLLPLSSFCYGLGVGKPRVQATLNITPGGFWRAEKPDDFGGTRSGGVDLIAGFGISSGIYLPTIKYFEMGLGVNLLLNLNEDGGERAGNVMDLVLPMRVPIVLMKTLELRPFLEVGLQLLTIEEAIGAGPVLIPGFGVEYKVGAKQNIGILCDLAYSMSWAKLHRLDSGLDYTILGTNQLQIRAGASIQL